MRFVVPVLIAFLGMGCFLNACGDNRHDVAGPGIDVHCNALAAKIEASLWKTSPFGTRFANLERLGSASL